MLKEIAEQPQAVADTLLGRIDADGRLRLDEMRLSDDELREVDKIVIIACGTAYHAGLIAKYAIEHWTRIPCEVELASEFRYRDPILDRGRRWSSRSRQSGETMDTLMAAAARARAARPGAGDLQRQRLDDPARVRRACSTRTPGPRSPSRRPRRSSPRSSPCYLVALYLAQVRGTKWGDEIARHDRDCSRDDAGEGRRRCSTRSSRCARWPVELADAKAVLFLGRHVGYPGGARGRAQAQGARLHARRGLRGGRAQARPDRADRGGPAGRRRRAVAARPAASCTTRSCPTSRRSGPAAPARS